MTASSGQLRLADSLLKERIIPEDVQAALTRRMNDTGVRPGELRADFDRIIKANYPRRGTSSRVTDWPDWSDTQQSSYALPSGCVPEETFRRLAGRHGEAEFIFFEIKEYRSKWYCKKLTGSPGSFSRSTVSAVDQQALHQYLMKSLAVQESATRLFGMLYSVCGVCKAELTDDLSRSLNMGPHCRKTRYGHKR